MNAVLMHVAKCNQLMQVVASFLKQMAASLPSLALDEATLQVVSASLVGPSSSLRQPARAPSDREVGQVFSITSGEKKYSLAFG